MQTTILLAAQASGGGDWTFLLMMVAIFAIMWIFMIMPQQKKQKKIREFQNSLQATSTSKHAVSMSRLPRASSSRLTSAMSSTTLLHCSRRSK